MKPDSPVKRAAKPKISRADANGSRSKRERNKAGQFRHASPARLKPKRQELDASQDQPNGTHSALPLELQRLVHDLRAHQIELEMQNQQLREMQTALEVSRNRYAQLYNSAPVGYIDFDPLGVVRQINVTGAELLQSHPTGLVGQRF